MILFEFIQMTDEIDFSCIN